MKKSTKKENKKKRKANLKKIKKKISSLIFETTGKSEEEIIDYTIDKGASILKSKIKAKKKKE